MAEFSLKDTLIGGGILFGIGVFIKKVKGKKQVEVDSQDWGGDPNGQLAKALARAREDSKKPREPLKIERLDAETEDSPPIEYSSYGRRINYLEMIYNAFYDPESSIYQLSQATISEAISYGEGFILPETAIFFDLRNGSSQLDGQRLSFMYGGNRGSRNKLKTNVKNALQRASGTKLSSSGRLHHGGLIGADYEYNGKMFFIRYNMRGRGNSRRTTLSVASQDSIPEYRRGEYPFSRAYEHENDYKYQGGAETFGAETRKLKKDSCECKNYTPDFNRERPMTTDDEEEQAVIVPITCDNCRKKGETVYLYGYNEYDDSNLKWFDAETRKLKKDSCCCGATKKNPCECMYQGISPCSSTCPCALENKKKEQSKGHMDFDAESDKKREVQKYRIGDMKVREYDDGTLERYEAQRIQYDYMVHREPRGTEVDDDGNRIPNPRGGRFTSADAESFSAFDPKDPHDKNRYSYERTNAMEQRIVNESFKPMRYSKVVRSGWSATTEPITIFVDKKLEEILKARGKGKTIKYDYNNPIEETSSDWVYVIHDPIMSKGTGFGIVDLERGVSSQSMGMFYDGKGKYDGDVVSFRLVRDGGTYRYEDLLVPNRSKGKKAETFDADGRDMTLEEIEETYGEGRLCDHCFDGTFERGTHDDGSTYYRCWKCKQFEAESFDACPCGCNGKIEYHDDRSYGCWECPRCGEDSDADIGEGCSYCVKMLDMEDNPQNYPSYQAETFESETVAFESFAGRWNVGQTKEIEGVQLTKLTSGRNAGFRMEYDGHVGEIVADDEMRNGGFFVFEGGGLGTGGSYRGLSASDQRECLIRWKHRVGGGRLVIRSPFKKARAILARGGRYRPYSGVFRPPSEAFSKANTFIRTSDGRVQMGRPPRKNEEWLGIRYDAETLGAEEVNGGYNDCCSSENIVVHHRGGANYHDDDKELSYYPAECSVCGVEYDAGLSMYGNSSSIQDLEVSALGAETFDDVKLKELLKQILDFENNRRARREYNEGWDYGRAESFEASTGDIEMDRTLLKEQIERFKDDPEMLEAIENMVQMYGVAGALNNIEMLDRWLEEWEREEKEEQEKEYKRFLRRNKGLTKELKKNPFYPSPFKAETFESETVAFESFRGRWNVGQTRDIEGVRVKKMRNGAFKLDFQGESIIIYDGQFYQINRNERGGFSMGRYDSALNGELLRSGYSEKDVPDNMEAIIRWKHRVGGGRLVIRSPFKKARHIFAGGLYNFTLPGQEYRGVFYPTNRGKTYRFIRRNGEPIVGRFPKKNEAWLDIRYDAETLGAEEVNGGYNDCCSSENIVVHHRGGANYHDDDKELSYYPAECSVCGVEYDAGLSMYGNSSSIQDLEVSALGAETFEAEGIKETEYTAKGDYKKLKGISAEGHYFTIVNSGRDSPYAILHDKRSWEKNKEDRKLPLKREERDMWLARCESSGAWTRFPDEWCVYCASHLNACACDDDYDAESFSAETFLANEMPFKSFWLVAKKGSKSFPAGQVGELRVYENGERTIVLDNNLIIPFYNQDLAYAYLNEHFMVYPKKGTTDKGMLMRAEGDHDDHDHDHEDIDELIEKINRVTDFAITFIHDGGFGGEPKGIIIDEELGLKTEIVNYVEGSIDLRLVRDLETNELVSVRFALTGDPDETPILYLPLPEQLTTVPEEERRIKES